MAKNQRQSPAPEYVAPFTPRTIYIAFEVFPKAKGATSHMAMLAQTLAEEHGPLLLLCCGHSDMPALQIEGDIIIRRHKAYHPNMLHRVIEFGRFVYRMLRNLPQQPELVIFRDPWGGAPALQALDGCPAVFEVNALPGWELPYSYPAIRNNAAMRAKILDLESFCLRRAAGFITVSSLTAEALMGLGVESDRLTIIPNAADDVFFTPPAPDGPVGPWLDGRWFGYFGSLHTWQGVDTLIRAWARIEGDFPGINLLIIHNNRRQAVKRLEKLARRLELDGRVFFQPPVPPEVLAGIIARLEFTCAPLLETARNTVQGCCPVKIVESMAAGTPVLASDLRVTRELISSGVDGLLVPSGDTRAWALSLGKLMQDNRVSRRLGMNARQTAGKRFSRKVTLERLERLIAQVTDEAGPRRDKNDN
ncbi:MAG: glycosyltransferase family 4 protein [Deltaproteobacteria bacterium]|nr:glycosyltransferase family 4 protein [Deltaproteobacteria bacterium]